MWLQPLTPQGRCLLTQFPFSSKSSPRGMGPELMASVSFLHMDLSYSLGCAGSLSPNLQLVFSENFSTCRCIFHVLLGVGELHILLLHLLNPPFQCNI